mmetsp:Transcript_30556/g.35313  ORF Transcript_30556/g.35313 Transcript_30556/m.35313 type:complete len:161 (-) Transcript_30556:445-927(-)|eukprot:CAMPEP_0176438178 /NCGR_PEP_ID=MMETSP0127-20121128/19118_1 /TAXON_ID=938130 /ORGANISM="Platyophrya macrostoma, Strain WH" /LENGTH=160 /DNA_ID=CAMNT_0017822057 /DNA_START=76 /DNA_END=558 /DNA_ORIENTATION=-
MRRAVSKCFLPTSARVAAAFIGSNLVFPSRSLHVTSCARCAATSPAAPFSSPPVSEINPPSASSAASAADAAASALDVATRVNKLKRLHQTGGAANQGKKQLEYTAWKELNTLTEEQINNAEGKAVALLLNSWAYFAKFWEKGKDGPAGVASDSGTAASR